MHTLLAVARTEIRMLWRRPLFWIVQILLLIPLVTNLLLLDGSFARLYPGQLVTQQIEGLTTALLLIAPLIAAPPFLRDLSRRGELLWATPLDAAIHFAGLFLGVMGALLPALLVHLAIRWLIPQLLGEPRALDVWRYGLPLSVVTLAVAVALSALLATLLRRMVLVVLAALALWAAVIVGLTGGTTLKSLALASPFNAVFNQMMILPSVGLGVLRPIVTALALWLLAIALVVAMVALGLTLLTDRRRRLVAPRRMALLAALLVALAGAGYLGHARSVQAATAPRSPYDNQAGLWQVREHEMTVTVDGTRLAGESVLALEAESDALESVVLRLNPQVRLTAAAEADGMPLTWQREGDSVRVTLPATATPTLHLRWEGTPQVNYADYASRTYHWPAMDFPELIGGALTDEVAFLRRDGDWYPWPWTPGPHNAATNHITITGAERALPLDLEPERLPEFLYLLPPRDQEQVDGITLYRSQTLRPAMQARLRQIARQLATTAAALDEPAPRHVVVLPTTSVAVWDGDRLVIPETEMFGSFREVWLWNVAAWQQQDNALLTERLLYRRIAELWWQQRAPAEPLGWIWVAPGQRELDLTPPLDPSARGRWISSRVPLNFRLGEEDGTTIADARDELTYWLSMELADPAIRAEELAMIDKVAAGNYRDFGRGFYQHELGFLAISGPVSAEEQGAVARKRAQRLQTLHAFAERVGRDEALSRFATTLPTMLPTATIDDLFEAMGVEP